MENIKNKEVEIFKKNKIKKKQILAINKIKYKNYQKKQLLN